MQAKKLFLSLLLLAALILSACQTPTPDAIQPTRAVDPLMAALTELQGGVGIKNAEAADFAPAQAGMTLQVNGIVRTESDGRVRLDLSSGTIVRVAPSSVFTLISNEVQPDQSLATKIKLELGQIFVVLNGGSAEVETPSGQASVRGSYMMVKIDPETKQVKITCLEGDCVAKTKLGEVSFAAGQVVILTFGDFPPELGEMSSEDFLEWLSNVPEAFDILSVATATIAARATETPAADSTPTPTPTGTPTASPACSPLLTPANGATLNAAGKVIFSWSEFPGAAKYSIILTHSSGSTSKFSQNDASMSLYIEHVPWGGDFTWQVFPLDAEGKVLCESQSFTFSKPSTPPTLTNTPAPEVVHDTTFALVAIYGTCSGMTFQVTVSDPDGINGDLVYVIYQLNGGTADAQSMGWDGDFYGSLYLTSALSGDTLSYYFQATDLTGVTSSGGGGTFVCPAY